MRHRHAVQPGYTTDNTLEDHEIEPPIEAEPESLERPNESRLSCEAYERLIQDLEGESPTDEDFRRLAQHEAACPSGRHTESGLESALGLPAGALRNGSPEDGLEDPKALVVRLVDEHLPAD